MHQKIKINIVVNKKFHKYSEHLLYVEIIHFILKFYFILKSLFIFILNNLKIIVSIKLHNSGYYNCILILFLNLY